MEKIAGRRHWRKFYLNVLCLTIYFLLLAFIVAMLYKEAITTIGGVFIVLISLSLIILALYTLFHYFKRVPHFYVSTHSLVFNNGAEFLWSNLERVELSGKKPFKYMFGYAKEGMMLKFTGSKEIYLYDDMYSNTAEIKRFIGYHITRKSNRLEVAISKPKFSAIANESFEWFGGNQLLSYRGIILWAILGFLLYGIMVLAPAAVTLLLLCLAIICFRAFSVFMYYFGLSDNYLVVRNPNLFWIKKVYRLSDIKEVVFEQQHSKMPYSLRIITTDFESNTFMGGTLWTGKWRQLHDKLGHKNIDIRNECIY